MISYAPFFRTMKLRNTNEYTLIHYHGVSSNTFHRIRHGEGISTLTVNKFCEILDCEVKDIIEYVKNEEGTEAMEPATKD